VPVTPSDSILQPVSECIHDHERDQAPGRGGSADTHASDS